MAGEPGSAADSGLNTPLPVLSPLVPRSLPVLSPQINLPILSPQDGEDHAHSNMTTPSLPSLSPAPSRQLYTPVPPSSLAQPSSLVSPQPQRVKKEERRDSGEGKLMRPDPLMSKPLSVFIPSEGTKAGKRTSPRSNKGLGSSPSPAPATNHTNR